MSQDLLPAPAATVDPLDELRARGWMAAVHNDYRLNGQFNTFWLFTHPCGRWVKGEGPTDAIALKQCLDQADRYSLENAPAHPCVVRFDGENHRHLTLSFNSYEDAQEYWRWSTQARRFEPDPGRSSE